MGDVQAACAAIGGDEVSDGGASVAIEGEEVVDSREAVGWRGGLAERRGGDGRGIAGAIITVGGEGGLRVEPALICLALRNGAMELISEGVQTTSRSEID